MTLVVTSLTFLVDDKSKTFDFDDLIVEHLAQVEAENAQLTDSGSTCDAGLGQIRFVIAASADDFNSASTAAQAGVLEAINLAGLTDNLTLIAQTAELADALQTA